MITAHYTIGDKPRGTGGVSLTTKSQEFLTIDALEDFLSYNRAYIKELRFSGILTFSSLEDEENN